jgi:DNA-binding CsgD family transcriptional regulator
MPLHRSKEKDPETRRTSGNAECVGIPGASFPRMTAILVGTWPAEFVSGLCVLRTAASVAALRQWRKTREIDWLLIETSIGRAQAADVITVLDGWGQARPRVAVLDMNGIWPPGLDCDIYQASGAAPEDLRAAMWLSSRGYEVKMNSQAPHGPPSPLGVLTRREMELLKALCSGLSNDQIAKAMRISRSTVEFHCRNIFRKLGVSSRLEALSIAHRHL